MKELQIPVLPEKYLERDRLCSRFEEQTDVFFLTGRKGCGKTSLLAQFCQGKESSVFWYSFQKEDNEEAYFCRYFPYEPSDAFENDPANGRGYHRILELPDDKNINYIVLDHLHLITNRRLLQVICRLLERLDGRHGTQKIFLAMSGRPAPCFSKYLAAGRYRIISDQEFCFFKEEVMQLTRVYFPAAVQSLKETSGRNVRRPKAGEASGRNVQSPKAGEASGRNVQSLKAGEASGRNVQSLEAGKITGRNVQNPGTEEVSGRILQLTGGWPIAVSYLLQYVQSSSGNLADVMEMHKMDLLMDTMLYDYIYYEIYGRFSAKEKLFLIQAAVFRRLDTELLKSCLGNEADCRILHRLRGEYLDCKTENGRKYQPLIRLFLLAQVPQQQKEKLESQAGAHYLQEREFAEAFYYLKKDADGIREMFLQYGREMMESAALELVGQCVELLKDKRKEWTEWTCQELGIAAEYYYRAGDREQMEACLNAADSMFGKENPYGMYRSLYRGLFHYREDCGKYGKQVNNAVFFLRENKIRLPFLLEREQRILDEIQKEKGSRLQIADGKKIRVFAFGTFRAIILEDGKELPWRTKKGCELFAYLLDRGGEAAERKTLLMELWHEEMPNNAVAMLHNMFYNIRKELSYYNLESLIQYKNRKYSMDTRIIQSDTEQIRMAAEYVEKRDLAMLLRCRQLFDTWWGMYLEDMDNVWIRDRQEYYEKIFEKGCVMLGTECMERQDYESGARYFKNALSVSCYSEKIMGMLLKCYSQAGELGSVKKQYEDFCGLLKRELDIEPGEELQAGYRECIGKG